MKYKILHQKMCALRMFLCCMSVTFLPYSAYGQQSKIDSTAVRRTYMLQLEALQAQAAKEF